MDFLLNIYFCFVGFAILSSSSSILTTKRVAAKERKIRQELKQVQDLGFDSFPQ
jgi:hypothetical protein